MVGTAREFGKNAEHGSRAVAVGMLIAEHPPQSGRVEARTGLR